MSSDEKKEKKSGCYLTTAISTMVFVVLIKLLWPNSIPFKLFEFWRFNGSWVDVFRTSWPLLFWGIGFTAIASAVTRNDPKENRHPGLFFTFEGISSVIAGVFEEISFRWMIFYGAIIGAIVSNFLFFGFLGFGIPEWIFNNIAGPVANFLTLGYLKEYLFGPLGWTVGAAIISANGKFRDGHMYKGIIGWINSWFGGMFFFYLMFTYGLLASILIHFLYDIFIYCIRLVDRIVEQKLGWI